MKTGKLKKYGVDFEPAEKILEEMHVPFVIVDGDGVVLHANPCCLNLYPDENGTLVGKHLWDNIAPEEREISRRSFHLAMKSKENPMPVQRSILTRDNGFRTFEVHRYLRLDPEGAPIGMCFLSFDVTEMAQRHEEERGSRIWSEMLIESLPDAVITVDALGIIHTANRAAEELTGWSNGSLLDQLVDKALRVENYVSPDGASLSHSISLTQPTKGRASLLNLRQEEIPVEIRTFPMRDKYTGVLTGITIMLRRQADLG